MSSLTVGVPREIKTAEHRVAMTPDGVRELENHGVEVFVERGAGHDSAIADSDYEAAGATIVPTAADAWAQQMVVKVKEPQERSSRCSDPTSPCSPTCTSPRIPTSRRHSSQQAPPASPTRPCSSPTARFRCSHR